MSNRIVCWFSCGAASAVATKLAILHNAGKRPLEVVYIRVAEEHPDNVRFLQDCEQWFGQSIQILGNDEYQHSIFTVFERTKYLVGPSGAACTRLLKKKVRSDFEKAGDRQVFGYTFEEENRVNRFIDANNHVDLWLPLIEKEYSKLDCFLLLYKAGIRLPEMYHLGYKNNNCIGCVKGGIGYWNKIRKDFPERFEQMAQVEEKLGRTICCIRKNGEYQRISLRELPPDIGRYETEGDMGCGIFCPEKPQKNELKKHELTEQFIHEPA